MEEKDGPPTSDPPKAEKHCCFISRLPKSDDTAKGCEDMVASVSSKSFQFVSRIENWKNGIEFWRMNVRHILSPKEDRKTTKSVPERRRLEEDLSTKKTTTLRRNVSNNPHAYPKNRASQISNAFKRRTITHHRKWRRKEARTQFRRHVFFFERRLFDDDAKRATAEALRAWTNHRGVARRRGVRVLRCAFETGLFSNFVWSINYSLCSTRARGRES